MQKLEAQLKAEPNNFASPQDELSPLKLSFIVDSSCTQPTIIFEPKPTHGISRFRPVIVREDIEAALARYVEHMSGTEFDLDSALEATSIHYILSTDGE